MMKKIVLLALALLAFGPVAAMAADEAGSSPDRSPAFVAPLPVLVLGLTALAQTETPADDDVSGPVPNCDCAVDGTNCAAGMPVNCSTDADCVGCSTKYGYQCNDPDEWDAADCDDLGSTPCGPAIKGTCSGGSCTGGVVRPGTSCPSGSVRDCVD